MQNTEREPIHKSFIYDFKWLLPTMMLLTLLVVIAAAIIQAI